jgi:endoglucanase
MLNMIKDRGNRAAILAIAYGFAVSLSTADGAVTYTGVNLAGAVFGEGSLPGTYGIHYTYPTAAEIDYFVGKGANTFRLPFRWERLQQTLNAPFNSAELSRLDNFINYATSHGAHVVLDPHNYARYHGNVIGSAAVPHSAFADFWTRLANEYMDNERVIFGLMNEPNSMPTEQWRDGAQAAISAIRNTGATNLIFVPGNAWTGAHSWSDNW